MLVCYLLVTYATVSYAGWLSGWDKRVKITVDSTNIDSDLTHFPLPLFLGTSVGTANDDVSFVFDELGNDANRKKIAVTETNGTTELYVEIEEWDTASQEAVLWVSRSDFTLLAASSTDLYLYYDAGQADNTTYVGDTNSAVAENVWDSDFEMVLHLAETAGTHYDSTTNDNDGANNGSNQDADGNINGANDFQDNDYVRVSNFAGLNNESAVTITYWTIQDTNSLSDYTLWADGNVLIQPGDSFNIPGATNLRLRWNLQGTWRNSHTEVGTLDTGVWHYWAFVFDNGDTDIYKDDQNVYNDTDVETSISANSPNYDIGFRSGQSGIDGIIDEFRISSTNRSTAWLKACYYAGDDNLIAWGSEEIEVGAVINPGSGSTVVIMPSGKTVIQGSSIE